MLPPIHRDLDPTRAEALRGLPEELLLHRPGSRLRSESKKGSVPHIDTYRHRPRCSSRIFEATRRMVALRRIDPAPTGKLGKTRPWRFAAEVRVSASRAGSGPIPRRWDLAGCRDDRAGAWDEASLGSLRDAPVRVHHQAHHVGRWEVPPRNPNRGTTTTTGPQVRCNLEHRKPHGGGE